MLLKPRPHVRLVRRNDFPFPLRDARIYPRHAMICSLTADTHRPIGRAANLQHCKAEFLNLY